MPHETNESRACYRHTGGKCALAALVLAAATSGCHSTRTQVAQALGTNSPAPVIREQTVEESYRIGCPDIVDISVEGMPEVSGQYPVSPDGRITLASLGNPRVEGHTTTTLADCVASEFGLLSGQVRCRVAEHRSRVVFVHGPIDGGDRAVMYRGPENVVSFIRRCGGLKPGADLQDIHIIRGNVAQGIKPQVIVVDLEGILLRGEPRTNVLLQPFDELCIGELPRSRIGKALPHWVRPIYRGFCGFFPWLCAHDWRQQIRDEEP